MFTSEQNSNLGTDFTFKLAAEHGDTSSGYRIARFIFDNSDGKYNKIKFSNYSNNVYLYVNNTQMLGSGDLYYNLPKSNNVTISVICIDNTSGYSFVTLII